MKFLRAPAAAMMPLSIAALLLLGACTGGGYTTTGAQTLGSSGIVTSDPSQMPDMSWQTPHQRQTLAQQNQPQPAAPAAANGTPVRVALLVPLSGKNANIGQAMLNAAQLALFDMGSNGFELIPADTHGTPAGAAAAAQKAAADGADLVLGPLFAEEVKAAKPVLAAANIPAVAFSTDWTLADGNTYVFGFLPFQQVNRVVSYAQSRNVNRLAVIAPNTEYANLVVSFLQRDGIRPVDTLRYAPGQADISQQVGAFAGRNKTADGGRTFDALLLPLGGESLRSLTALLDQHGLRQGRLLGTGLWDDPGALSDPLLTGGWFAAPDPRARHDFERRYQQTYGGQPLRLATLAYDATALAAVLARSDDSGEPYSRSRMTAGRGFAGIDGVFRFRSDGLAERGLAVLEIGGGAARVIDPAPTAFGRGGM
jgi:ABC-type branched-subunit amino acid transport system substrate-binding protein